MRCLYIKPFLNLNISLPFWKSEICTVCAGFFEIHPICFTVATVFSYMLYFLSQKLKIMQLENQYFKFLTNIWIKTQLSSQLYSLGRCSKRGQGEKFHRKLNDEWKWGNDWRMYNLILDMKINQCHYFGPKRVIVIFKCVYKVRAYSRPTLEKWRRQPKPITTFFVIILLLFSVFTSKYICH